MILALILTGTRTSAGSPAADASSTFGRRRGPCVFDRIMVADAANGTREFNRRGETPEPSRSWRHTRKNARHPRDRSARFHDSIRDLAIAATQIPHGIVGHRADSTSIGRTRS